MKNMFVFLFLFAIVFQGFAQDYRTHEVEKGDTVYKLANEYGTTEEAIYALNPDAENAIHIGQVLVLPPKKIGETKSRKPLSFQNYVVKQKETIFGISHQNGIDMSELKKYNPYLYEDELGMGDTIQIPVFTKEKPKPINYNESIQNSSFGNLLHVVLPGETAYSIAKKYGMKLSRLREMNLGMNVIEPGQLLAVSRGKETKPSPILDEDSFMYYTVKPYNEGRSETIFSLTRKFGVSRDSLYSLNPQLREHGLEAGMKLKVPIRNEGTSLSNIGAEITDLEKNIFNYDPKNLVVFLPFRLADFEPDSLATQREILKKNRIAQISLDFYSGVLMALDKAKEMGLSVNLKTYDTEQSQDKILNILRNNDFSEVEAVIGPLLADQVETVAQRLSRQQVPVFSPLTKMEMNAYENLFQTRPTDEQLQRTMINYLNSLHTDENIVIIADDKHEAIKNQLNLQFPMATTVDITGEYTEKENFLPVLQKETKNWVILEAENIGLIGSVLAHLNSLVIEGYDIELFTTDRHQSYDSDEVSNLNLGRLHFAFPSFTKEIEQDPLMEFAEAYKTKHGFKPNQFTVRGYDLTYDVLLRLAAAEDFFESLEANWTTEYNENKFHYVEKENGGYFNTAVYILQYQEDLTTKPVQL